MLSPYGKFFVEFIGQQFYNQNGNIVYKDEVWREHLEKFSDAIASNRLTNENLRKYLQKRYSIKDKPGYINGQVFSKDLARLYYDVGDEVQKLMPIKYKQWHDAKLRNLNKITV